MGSSRRREAKSTSSVPVFSVCTDVNALGHAYSSFRGAGMGPNEEVCMPKFMDYHADLKLPADAIRMLGEAAASGTYDQFQSRQLEVFYNTDGKVFCLVEAPNEEAVRQRHTSMGVDCGDVHKVRSLL